MRLRVVQVDHQRRLARATSDCRSSDCAQERAGSKSGKPRLVPLILLMQMFQQIRSHFAVDGNKARRNNKEQSYGVSVVECEFFTPLAEADRAQDS